MSPAVAENLPAESKDLQSAVDQIIVDCDGDPRAAIRALIVANGYLERKLENVLASVSTGYVRGRYNDQSRVG
jgi:hypothetical protein